MSGFSGLDPESVDRLSAGLRSQAAVLGGIAASVDGLVEETGWVWQGPRAEEFAGWWWQQHRPALLAAVEALEGLAQSARDNAQDQRRVSGDGGSSPSTRPSDSVWAQSGSWLRAMADHPAVQLATAGTGALGLLGRVQVLGRYTDRYRSVAAFVSGTTVKGWQSGGSLASRLTHYKASPVLQHLQPGTGLGRTVDASGRLLSGLSIAADAHKSLSSLVAGDLHTAATSGADGASTALKSAHNPAAYVGGIAVSAWSEVAKEARDVRWDEGVPSPLGENWSTIWVPALKETGVEFTKRLPKILF